jgi:hypothetical protein
MSATATGMSYRVWKGKKSSATTGSKQGKEEVEEMKVTLVI